MRVGEMLDRCIGLERRAAEMYRRFAAQSSPGDELHGLWLRLASEEDEHAAAIGRAIAAPAGAEQSRIDGWTEAVEEAERVLGEAEAATTSSRDDRLALALDLERTEIDTLREALLALAGQADPGAHATSRHAAELAEVATRCSTDARVQLKAALVRAHERLAGGVSPAR